MRPLRMMALGTLALSLACGEDKLIPAADLTVTPPTTTLVIQSEGGCLLDVDCAAGLFCFQSQCTWECRGDEDCGADAVCSDRGRCLVATGDLPIWDSEDAAELPGQVTVRVTEAPPAVVEVEPGAPFVSLRLRTAEAVPGGALLYRVELEGREGELPQSKRAPGERDFLLQIPTGVASGEEGDPKLQRVTVVTSVGAFPVDLIPKLSVSGVYAGEVSIREFGGGGIPLRFALRVVPEDANFAEAQERYVYLPVSDQEIFAPLRETGGDEGWVERPLEFDEQAGVWFARFGHAFDLDDASLFAREAGVKRSLRLEIHTIEERRIFGALADRWDGLFDARSADGIVVPGQILLAGRLEARRVEPLPAEVDDAISGSFLPPEGASDRRLGLVACDGTIYAELVAAHADEEGACEGMAQPRGFERAESWERARCALAVADDVLEGPTTASHVLAFLDESQPNPGGLSFGAFLERCAAGDGYCTTSAELECTGDLLAYAYRAQEGELQEAGDLLERYQLVAREAYLGRQLAAFHVDTQTRLEWLRKSEAPLFLASALLAYNEDILSKWERQVLQAHFDVLEQQFTQANLEVLARAPTHATAISTRKQMLLEQGQAWQGAMESLQIAAERWNSLYQDDSRRERAAQTVRRRVLDLYLSAGTLAHLNRSSGSSATSAIFGSGFAALLRSLASLSLPFDERLFMRDADVVVSRSVDPEQSSRTLLRDLESLARMAVRDAQESVDRVLAEAHADELQAKVLTDRMYAQEEELRAELVALCGLPDGCALGDVLERPECRVRTEVGACGFLVDPQGEAYESFEEMERRENVSEAGRAMLRYREAYLDAQIAREEFRANEEKARIEYANAEAFARKLEEWDAMRAAVAAEVSSISREISAIANRTLRAELRTIEQMQGMRERAYLEQRQAVATWNEMRLEGVRADMGKMTSINALQRSADFLNLAGSEADRLAEVIADGLPKSVGAATDVAAPLRAVMGMTAYGITSAMRAVAFSLDTAAVRLQQELEEEQARRDAQLTHLADLQSLGAMQTATELEALSARLTSLQLESDAQIQGLEALIDSLRRNLEADIAHDRDLIELRDRRERVRLRLADSSARKAAILRADMVVAQRLQEYLQVVQRAQLLEGRHLALVERLQHLEVLIASPSVIFAFSNRLARAESRLERAKSLLYDWLVALEYYAVRPFLDQRLAVLLARNPSQLEAIANELLRLQRACGGAVNYEVQELSVRDDLLGLGVELAVPVEGAPRLAPGERFRALLQKGNVPVDTQIRYSTDERIGDLIASREVLAVSFDIRLEDFANLPLACNAKIASIDVQLVGEGLGENVRPVVSLLYDGESRLRSCQPNIDAIVGALPPGRTSFGPVTSFRTQGRSISPIANIGTFGAEDSANRGLEGLPLASSYTLLIDPEAGENKRVDWSRLEDVRLELTYAYQDLFPMGQCQ